MSRFWGNSRPWRRGTAESPYGRRFPPESGNMDTCIAIRIAFKKNGKVFVRSGAGIVADSVPEKEFDECNNFTLNQFWRLRVKKYFSIFLLSGDSYEGYILRLPERKGYVS
ncbi:MAG: chorismate-binding protein [Treponema sp.]|nr:chorismate-binding protein [Treponema sp.]